jgi:hypothetical protein
MSANGLGKLLESHSQTLQDLQLRYITFGDGDNFMAMFAQICAFTNLDSLDMIGLRQGGVKLKVDRETESSRFSAQGRTAIQDLWRRYAACYRV